MSINQTFNGTVYPIPTQGDLNWGPNATRYWVALGSFALAPSGGLFTLTADVNLGPSFGILGPYFSGRGLVASSGLLRLSKTDTVAWKNNGGTGNNVLSTDSSDNLLWNGVQVATGIQTLLNGKIWIGSAGNAPVAQTLTGDVTVTNSGVTSITADTIVNNDVNSAAAIAYSKLALTGSIVNTDIDSAAGITYSKLALANSIVNNDINTSAAIDASKIANGAVSSTEFQYLDGVTSAIQAQLNSKQASGTYVTSITGTSNQIAVGGTSTVPVLSLTSPLILSGIIETSDGSFTTPSHTFTNDTLTGLYNAPQPTVTAAAANWNTSTHAVASITHGLYQQTQGQLTTSGSLPAGLSLATDYFVIWVDADHFALASTAGNAANGVKIAFTTQGSGNHTFTPTASLNHHLGVAVNSTSFLSVDSGQLFVGGRTQSTQPSELIHVEGTGGVASDHSADIIVYNTAGYSGRLIASTTSPSSNPIVTSYLTAYGINDSSAFWTSGPSQTNANEVLLQNGAVQVLRVLDGGADTYFYNTNASPTWRFVHNANTEDFRIISGGIQFPDATQQTTAAPVSTDWASYSPTIGGCGTVTSNTAYWKQTGKHIFVKGYFITGTVAGSTFTISLPNSTVIATAHTVANEILGHGIQQTSSGTPRLLNFAAPDYMVLFTDGSTNTTVFGSIQTVSNGFVKNQGGSMFGGSGWSLSYIFDYPI